MDLSAARRVLEKYHLNYRIKSECQKRKITDDPYNSKERAKVTSFCVCEEIEKRRKKMQMPNVSKDIIKECNDAIDELEKARECIEKSLLNDYYNR